MRNVQIDWRDPGHQNIERTHSGSFDSQALQRKQQAHSDYERWKQQQQQQQGAEALKQWLKQQQIKWLLNAPLSELYSTSEFVRSPDIYKYVESGEQQLGNLLKSNQRYTGAIEGLLHQTGSMPAQYRPQLMQAFDYMGNQLQAGMGTLQRWASPEAFRAQTDPLLNRYEQALYGTGVAGQPSIAAQRSALIGRYGQELQAAQQQREAFTQGQLRDIADQAARLATANAMRNVNLFGAAQGTGGAGTSLASLAARAATEAALPYQQRWGELMLGVLGGRSGVASALFDVGRYGIEAGRADLADVLGRRMNVVDYTTRLAPSYTQQMLSLAGEYADLPRQRLMTDLALQDVALQALQSAQAARQADYDQALQNIMNWAQLRGLAVEDVVRPRYPTYAGIPIMYANV